VLTRRYSIACVYGALLLVLALCAGFDARSALAGR
jgi:hypothetical protein